jgi:hypothetical protein
MQNESDQIERASSTEDKRTAYAVLWQPLQLQMSPSPPLHQPPSAAWQYFYLSKKILAN